MSENFKNLEVGKTLKVGNKELRVEQAETQNSCGNCIFKSKDVDCCYLQEIQIIPECDAIYRADNKSVVFVEMQNKKMNKN